LRKEILMAKKMSRRRRKKKLKIIKTKKESMRLK